MAVTVYARDLDNYPDIQKSMTVNLSQLIPTGADGDEKWVVSLTTSAYSNNTNRTSIQDIYISDTKRGWIKSSGLLSSPFTLTGSDNKLKVRIDNVATGTYEITLETGSNLTGEDIAADIETKLRAEADAGGGQQNNLSYLGATCIWDENKFWIYSGTIDSSFGSSGSSVVIEDASSNDAQTVLGFDLGTSSFWLTANPTITVASTSSAGPGAGVIQVNSGLGITGSGYACSITNGTTTEYFVTNSGTTESNLWPINSITGTYAAGSRVAKIVTGDSDNPAYGGMDTVDDAVRWGLDAMIEQIDFSS
jgi:hypothetical protein